VSRPPARVLHDRTLVLTIPQSDGLFRLVVERQVRASKRGETTLRAARQLLRLSYPQADLTLQQHVRAGDVSLEVWLAHRDGASRPLQPSDSWWRSRGIATITLGDDGRLGYANERGRSLLGLAPRSRRLMLRDLVSPELLLEICASARALASRPEMVGSVMIRLPSGVPLEVDYRVSGGRTVRPHLVSLRSVAEREATNDAAAMRRSSLGSLPAKVGRGVLQSGLRQALEARDRLATTLTEDEWAVLVVSGIVRVYLILDGGEATVAYATGGALIGTHLMSAPEPYLLGVQSMTPSVIVQISPSRIHDLAASNRAFAEAVAADTQRYLRALIDTVATRPVTSLRRRLAAELVELGGLQPTMPLVEVTEQQLAEGVGSIRESIGRAIADLRSAGLVATTRHGVLVIDRSRLRDAARGT
jgi:CRP/FNR family cyclic AMP-dependent transcriptional regulator